MKVYEHNSVVLDSSDLQNNIVPKGAVDKPYLFLSGKYAKENCTCWEVDECYVKSCKLGLVEVIPGSPLTLIPMKKYKVEYLIRSFHTRIIEAESSDKAAKIAETESWKRHRDNIYDIVEVSEVPTAPSNVEQQKGKDDEKLVVYLLQRDNGEWWGYCGWTKVWKHAASYSSMEEIKELIADPKICACNVTVHKLSSEAVFQYKYRPAVHIPGD